MLRFFLSLVIACLALAVAIPIAAAQPRPDLVVTLRDAAGAGVAGVVVEVRDDGDGATVAHETTDAIGTAIFPTLAVSGVRVLVRGHLASGIALRQPGQDAEGIAFYLGAVGSRLDLRVEADGTVLPDPQTMLAPDVGIDDGAIPVATPQTAAPIAPATRDVPTAPADPTAAQPAVASPTVAPVIPVDMTDTPITDTPVPSSFGWLILVVLGCALLMAFLLLVLQRRGA